MLYSGHTPMDHEYLCADDVLLLPQMGILQSRTNAELKPFIYSAPMDRVYSLKLASELLRLGETPVVCRDIPEMEYVESLSLFSGTQTFFAIGATSEEVKRFESKFHLAETMFHKELPPVNIAIDIAHGDSTVAYRAIDYCRTKSWCNQIMSGSIATPAAAKRCINAGVNTLRVGIGPGSMCTTRLMTGIGVPQLTAVYQIAKHIEPTIELIADGGIRYPGDAVKYLAAGATAVMLGSRFSRTKESPGWDINGFKTYRGHASAEFQKDTKGKANRCPEGVSSKYFEWEGETVETIVEEFRGGISSSLSYLGLTKLEDLKPTAVQFIKITTNTNLESGVRT